MRELIIAFGLLLFIEGILYALFPSKMKNMLKAIEKIELPANLRTGGLIFAIIGFTIVWYMLKINMLFKNFKFLILIRSAITCSFIKCIC